MKLEIGKRYKSRSGIVYTITTFNGSTYGYGSVSAMWYEGGYALCNRAPHPYDLIEEVKECNMEFLTDNGISNMGEAGPLKVGDRVVFTDGSYACYPTKGGFKNDHPAMSGKEERGVILATGCNLPALYYGDHYSQKEYNNTVVFTDSGKTYFTRLVFLKRI